MAYGFPTGSNVEDPELTAGYFQGDMKMKIAGRNGLRDPIDHWPGGIVYFNVSDSIGMILDNFTRFHLFEVSVLQTTLTTTTLLRD